MWSLAHINRDSRLTPKRRLSTLWEAWYTVMKDGEILREFLNLPPEGQAQVEDLIEFPGQLRIGASKRQRDCDCSC